MKFPAYGRGVWNRRLLGDRVRVLALLVGNTWKIPRHLAIPPEVPRLAVKTAAWHDAACERFDWRVVAECTVLAVDTRGPDEREAGPDDWDPWLWLLADVHRYARDVLRFTSTEEFHDPPSRFAAERDLECLAWCSGKYCGKNFLWPPWWPHGSLIHERRRPPMGAAA